MNLSNCRELIVLADQLSFSKAAERLYITQSALSKHVAAMEKEVGFRIFDRDTSKVELTESGRIYVDNLRGIVEEYENALKLARRHQQDQVDTVEVVGPLANEKILHLVTSARSRLYSANANLRMSIIDTGVRDNLENLIERRADIAIAFDYGHLDRRLRSEHLAEIPFGIACHKDHPLANKPTLSFDDISKVGHIESYPLESRAEYHRFVRMACKKHSIGAIVENVAEGSMCFPEIEGSIVFGVHFPGYVRLGEDIVSRALDDRAETFMLCAIKRKRENREAVLNLYDAIVEEFRSRGF